MNVVELSIKDLKVIEPKVFEDPRGFFLESYSQAKLKDQGIDIEFVQDNHSRSSKGILRGLHFQAPPFAQDKLVRVVRGKVLDVALDVRVGSPTYGKFEIIELSEDNKKMFLIPKGFAHGFVVLSDSADFLYKTSEYYHPEVDGGVLWNDPDLDIPWSITDPLLSEKDKNLPLFKNLVSPFKYE
jgi:dTDP-4-dehydrorhamnose 3,5-epimerase